jgi:hypothetical protein
VGCHFPNEAKRSRTLMRTRVRFRRKRPPIRGSNDNKPNNIKNLLSKSFVLLDHLLDRPCFQDNSRFDMGGGGTLWSQLKGDLDHPG